MNRWERLQATQKYAIRSHENPSWACTMIHNQCATIPSIERPDTEGQSSASYCQAFDKTLSKPKLYSYIKRIRELGHCPLLSNECKDCSNGWKSLLRNIAGYIISFILLTRDPHQNPSINYPGNYQQAHERKRHYCQSPCQVKCHEITTKEKRSIHDEVG